MKYKGAEFGITAITLIDSRNLLHRPMDEPSR